MLITIAIILAILWLLGFSFDIGGAFIHLVLLVALIVLLYDLFTRRGRL